MNQTIQNAENYGIRNRKKMIELMERNKPQWSKKFPRIIIRTRKDGSRRWLCYNSEEQLSFVRRYPPDRKMYSYKDNCFFKEKSYDSFEYDIHGNYYKSEIEKPFRHFSNFKELLTYCRKEKAKQDKPKNSIRKFFGNLFTNNFDPIIVNTSTRNHKGNALTRQINRKKALVKPFQERVNSKLILSGFGALCGLSASLLGETWTGVCCMCANLPMLTTSIADKFIFRKQALNHEYKELKCSPEYKNILKRAKRIFH